MAGCCMIRVPTIRACLENFLCMRSSPKWRVREFGRVREAKIFETDISLSIQLSGIDFCLISENFTSKYLKMVFEISSL